MDITLNNFARKTFYQVDPTLAAILVELGLADKVERAVPPRPTVPTWGIGTTLTGHARIVLQLPSGETKSYDGPPERSKDGFKTLVWVASEQARLLEGLEPPAEIIDAYKAKYTPRAFANSGSMAAYGAAMQRNSSK